MPKSGNGGTAPNESIVRDHSILHHVSTSRASHLQRLLPTFDPDEEGRRPAEMGLSGIQALLTHALVMSNPMNPMMDAGQTK